MCFANADGGTIVLGADSGRTREGALVGVPDAYTPDGIRTAIFERTRPNVMVFVDERIVGSARLLLIDVPPGVTPCSTSGGTATRRLGNRYLPFPPDQQRELLIARGQLDWTSPTGRTYHVGPTPADHFPPGAPAAPGAASPSDTGEADDPGDPPF